MNQAETLQRMMDARAMAAPQGNMPRVISISSGKGGVGKTNVTANLAYALTGLGQRVLILDADLNLANIDVLLGLTPRYTLQHVFNGEKSLADVLVEGPGGMRILPGSSGILELAELSESQKLFLLEEMESMARQLDFLLIDTAAGINNNVVYFNLAAQERVVLLTPEPTSLTDAYALMKVLSNQHDVKRFRILVNQVVDEREALQVFKKITLVCDRFLDSLSLDFLGFLPQDSKIPAAVRRQQLVARQYPQSPVSGVFRQLAKDLCAEEPPQGLNGNIQFFWRGLFALQPS